MKPHPDQPDQPNLETDVASNAPLQSWKEIAAYLDRDVRTARRWEQAEGLPVRRHRSGARSSVYAYRAELDAWRAERRPKTAAAGLLPRYAWGLAGLVVLVGSSFWLARGVGVGPLVDAQEPGVGIARSRSVTLATGAAQRRPTGGTCRWRTGVPGTWLSMTSRQKNNAGSPTRALGRPAPASRAGPSFRPTVDSSPTHGASRRTKTGTTIFALSLPMTPMPSPALSTATPSSITSNRPGGHLRARS